MMITFYKQNKSGILYYYAIHDHQGTLFPAYSFTTIWGKELNTGREKHYSFENRTSLENRLVQIINKRIKDGYRILYRYSKDTPSLEKMTFS